MDLIYDPKWSETSLWIAWSTEDTPNRQDMKSFYCGKEAGSYLLQEINDKLENSPEIPWKKMAPPLVQKCYVPDCEYKTPENLNTLELQIPDLELHLNGAHHEHGRANDLIVSQGFAGAAKPDKLPRPSLDEGITETDWVWFEER